MVSLFLTYYLCLFVLAGYGAHRVWLLAGVRASRDPEAREAPRVWPKVTVQLPLFNEAAVTSRLLKSVAELDYPKHLLEIQVLDDSDDETVDIVDSTAAELRQNDLCVRVVRRPGRRGFKAGALAHGLNIAEGDFLAVFDADFIPPRDFLKRTVPLMSCRVGMVQARWEFLDEDRSAFSRAQAVLLRGHFAVEHRVRASKGCWFNFNGTAGLWNKEAIIDAGGWQGDTLTEDLDLSYRAQLKGWKFIYLDDLAVPSELPARMDDFLQQQQRWARGGAQTARKLLPQIWRSSAPFGVKLDATIHLTANLGYALLAAITLCLPGVVLARTILSSVSGLAVLDLLGFLFCIVPFWLYYAVGLARSKHPTSAADYVAIPLALALGVGIALRQTVAVIGGLFGDVGEFMRTPKWGITSPLRSRTVPRLPEILALCLCLASCIGAVWAGQYASLPFFSIFLFGYLWVGLSTVFESIGAND